MAPVLGERDRQAVIDSLRRLAAIERSKRRHPSGGRRPNQSDEFGLPTPRP
jgi:hypothetical protein